VSIAVDLDATLAEYHGWKGIEHIGPPIPLMVRRVQDWIKSGKQVVIFTARISRHGDEATKHIEEWCIKHIGKKLKVTNIKDPSFEAMYDDRAYHVVPNTGVSIGDDSGGNE